MRRGPKESRDQARASRGTRALQHLLGRSDAGIALRTRVQRRIERSHFACNSVNSASQRHG